MPYGAVIDGDLSGIGFSDEIRVAVAGPFCNLVTAAAFAALWWFFPVTYAFTDSACFVSLALALVNLLPAYPLDGGRVLFAALSLKMKKERAGKICKAVALVTAAGLFGAFALLCVKGTPNFTLLLFAAFVGVGAFGNFGKSKAAYTKIDFSSKNAFRRGVPVRRVAVADSCTLKKAVGFVTQGEYLVLDVYDEGENYLGEVRQNDLAEIFYSSDIYRKIGEFL